MISELDSQVMLDAGYPLAEVAQMTYCPCGYDGEIGLYLMDGRMVCGTCWTIGRPTWLN